MSFVERGWWSRSWFQLWMVAAGSHTVVIIFLSLAYCAGLFTTAPPYDDIYFPFMIVSGPIVFIAGQWVTVYMNDFVFATFPYNTASNIIICVIPASVHIVCVALQLLVMLYLVRRWLPQRRVNVG